MFVIKIYALKHFKQNATYILGTWHSQHSWTSFVFV